MAEEVRNLAARSQSSAKEITEMIADSIDKVDAGTKLAMQTAGALDIIVQNVSGVSGLVTKISESSSDQAEAISRVKVGLLAINEVVQSNSSTSEESAASAEELNSQAETLKQMISYFKI